MTLENKQAPAFNLAGSDGKNHALSDYQGRTVVLYFYPKDDTPGCTKEACGFRDLNRDIQNAGAVILGISRDSTESHQRFIKKYDLPFVLLTDPDGAVMKQYGAFGKKMMYGKETEGVIRSTLVIGPDGLVIKHWPKVCNADTHAEEVLAAIQP